ncbi:hypothetical protein CEP52_014428 [Fusarium oligoseptatum]|uniref:Uncharacterized protein n=1 Tax=Fusarium oligoseptatum TaxID=2604345 RepID=A0A428SMA1_9HYPO|nr:hypothetical protein CEP52_014428 [Fusarium oligoseptatum]
MVALEHVKDALAMGGSILTIISNTLSIVKATYKAWRKPSKSGDLAAEDRDLELGILSAEPKGSIGAAFATAINGAIAPILIRMEQYEINADDTKEWLRNNKTRMAELEAAHGTLEVDLSNLIKRVNGVELELRSLRPSAIPSRPGSPGLRHRQPMMMTTEERLRVLEE